MKPALKYVQLCPCVTNRLESPHSNTRPDLFTSHCKRDAKKKPLWGAPTQKKNKKHNPEKVPQRSKSKTQNESISGYTQVITCEETKSPFFKCERQERAREKERRTSDSPGGNRVKEGKPRSLLGSYNYYDYYHHYYYYSPSSEKNMITI